jgi:flagellum-specific peptidoglycan hydrolase FlgJ
MEFFMPTIPKEIIAAAQASQAKWGVPASVSIAQWAIESGYGAHMPPGSHNPFGIKARPGQPSVDAVTAEFIGGRTIHVVQSFRKFASAAEAFDLHGQLLHDGRPYQHATTLAGNAEAFANALTGVYATDLHYGRSLIALMKALNLHQYDRATKAA